MTEPDDVAPAQALHPWAAVALTFGSSAAVLVLELTALRLIAPYVGLTMETNTAVIGLALAAIAFGSWLGGISADHQSPRAMIGPLLVLGGALTLVVSPAVRWMAGAATPEGAAGAALLLAAVTVFAPAAVLSAVPPMVVKLQLAALSETGSVVGRLSAIGTLGAIAATFLTGFVLIALFPVNTILLATGILLIAGGLVTTVTARRRGEAGSTGLVGPLTIAAIAGGLGLVAPNPCEFETRYHCASVQADPNRPSGRTLVLDTLRHSYVDLDDPTFLEFDYIRAIAGTIDSVRPGESLELLHMGGGAMTIPRYVLETRPGSQQTVVEIDPGVVEIDRTELGLPDTEKLEVRTADARTEISDLPTDQYDVFVGDAFGGVAVPWHLTTREAFSEVKRVVKPGGLVALNIIDYGPLDFLGAEIATVREQFEHVAVYEQVGQAYVGGNFVIVASDEALDLNAINAGVSAQDAPMALMSDGEVRDLAESARVLTDDFAPVDQLLSHS